MHIDFVSDIACPWCAVGLHALERALDELRAELQPSLSFQPFELNPSMGREGADTLEYLGAKYGLGPEELRRNQAAIRERGAAVGFAFGERARVWNTFDAHRLLHWAGAHGDPGTQRALKHALLRAYHGEGRNPSDREVLLDREVLRAALQRAAILSNEKYRGVRVEVSPGQLKISAHNPEQEEAQEEIEADTKVDGLAIGFNVNYLLDALSALRDEHVVLQLRDANSSALVREASSEKSRHVVMPLRL